MQDQPENTDKPRPVHFRPTVVTVGSAAALALSAAIAIGVNTHDAEQTAPAPAPAAAVVVPTSAPSQTPITTSAIVPSEPAPTPSETPELIEDFAESIHHQRPPAPSAPEHLGQVASEIAEVVTVPYTNDLDGWIREALDIMAANGIPGSYEGIHRNILRESSGNPSAINLWDTNAAMGIPSKGLLQVIDPTFAAYHVAGTPFDIWNPVSNIVAACNYAANRYGSMDNVHGPY